MLGFCPGVNVKLHFLHLQTDRKNILVELRINLLDVMIQARIKDIKAALRTSDEDFTVLWVVIDTEAV